MTSIVRSEEVLGGDPRIEGTRVGVLHVYELVVEGEHAPADVADQLDVSLADVYAALAYYHEHSEEMRSVRKRHNELSERLSEVAVTPPEPVR